MKLRFFIASLAILSAATLFIALSIFYTHTVDSSYKEAKYQAVVDILSATKEMSTYFSEYERRVKSLANCGFIMEFMKKQISTSRNTASRHAANASLKTFCEAFSADVCYVMDKSGTTIATSNYDAGDSFLGKNYSFRPYFKEAIKGRGFIYLALGVTSKKRGVYASFPIYVKNSESPDGVIIMKTAADYLEKQVFHHTNGSVMLVNPSGVVFMSNEQKWLYNTLWKIDEKEILDLRKSKQFGNMPLDWLGFKRVSDSIVTDKNGIDYNIYENFLKSPGGWSLIVLQNIKEVKDKISKPFMQSIDKVIMVSLILTGLSIILIYKRTAKEVRNRENVEKKLTESELKYRSVVENIAIGVVMINSQMEIISCNRQMRTWFPKIDEHKKIKCYRAFDEPSSESICPECPAHKTLMDGKINESVTKADYGDKIVSYRIVASPIKDDNGNTTAVVELIEDITERINKDEELEKYRNSLELLVEQRTGELKTAVKKIKDLGDEVLMKLIKASEYKDSDTGAHITRMGLYAKRLSESLGYSKEFIDSIRFAAPLHDIGKIGIAEDILLKKGRLTNEEFEAMKEHTTIGAEILAGSSNPKIWMAESIAMWHHERFDGGGYPDGLRGSSIPVEARIVNLCDQYDALRMKRPYKEAFSHEKAFNIITNGDGRTLPGHFDPEVLKAFVLVAGDFAKIFDEAKG